MKHEPTIIIDFNQKRMKFEKPLQIWQTHKLEEISGIFEKVQEAIDGQFYVAGYVSYECAPAFERHFSVCEPDAEIPLVWFGVYERPVEEVDIAPKGCTPFQTGVQVRTVWSIQTTLKAFMRRLLVERRTKSTIPRV